MVDGETGDFPSELRSLSWDPGCFPSMNILRLVGEFLYVPLDEAICLHAAALASPSQCGNSRLPSMASAAHAPRYTESATPCPL